MSLKNFSIFMMFARVGAFAATKTSAQCGILPSRFFREMKNKVQKSSRFSFW